MTCARQEHLPHDAKSDAIRAVEITTNAYRSVEYSKQMHEESLKDKELELHRQHVQWERERTRLEQQNDMEKTRLQEFRLVAERANDAGEAPFKETYDQLVERHEEKIRQERTSRRVHEERMAEHEATGKVNWWGGFVAGAVTTLICAFFSAQYVKNNR